MTVPTRSPMGTMISPAQFQALADYPQGKFPDPDEGRWVCLCEALGAYVPPQLTLTITAERKWELVSALQKSIRRGDRAVALQVIGLMATLPEEYPYFWRRLCITACEDVGPADDLLARFVIACSAIFTPKRTGAANYRLLCFLAEQMCELASRCRIYCSYAVIEVAAKASMLPRLSGEEQRVVTAILDHAESVLHPLSAWQQWQRSNDWRAAGLLKFLGLDLPLQRTRVATALPPHRMMWGLPSYCYDMYTRVGLEMLKRLVRGAYGMEDIRRLFQENPVKGAHTALGEALFFEEGGRIAGELIYEPLSALEQKAFSHQFDLPISDWLRLRKLAAQALADGVVDRIREDVLTQFYGGRSCNQLHDQMTLEF